MSSPSLHSSAHCIATATASTTTAAPASSSSLHASTATASTSVTATASTSTTEWCPVARDASTCAASGASSRSRRAMASAPASAHAKVPRCTRRDSGPRRKAIHGVVPSARTVASRRTFQKWRGRWRERRSARPSSAASRVASDASMTRSAVITHPPGPLAGAAAVSADLRGPNSRAMASAASCAVANRPTLRAAFLPRILA
mmetsp:Transcript_36236/g.113548  ORF Transcript_36236/g.113548 Transcript_36236/m.113548 type:complete len:202 (-) Transcript_36236:429-1034(-)